MKDITPQNIYFIFSRVFNSDDFKKLSNLKKETSPSHKKMKISIPLKSSEQKLLDDNRFNEEVENHLFIELKQILFKEICNFIYQNNDICNLESLNKIGLTNKVILGGAASLVKITNTNNKVLDYNKEFGDTKFVVSDKVVFELDVNSLNITKNETSLILRFSYNQKL